MQIFHIINPYLLSLQQARVSISKTMAGTALVSPGDKQNVPLVSVYDRLVHLSVLGGGGGEAGRCVAFEYLVEIL